MDSDRSSFDYLDGFHSFYIPPPTQKSRFPMWVPIVVGYYYYYYGFYPIFKVFPYISEIRFDSKKTNFRFWFYIQKYIW